MLLLGEPKGQHTTFKSFQFFVSCESLFLKFRQEHRLKTPKKISGPKKEGVKETVKECIMERLVICVLSHRILLKVVKSKEYETGDGITQRIKQDYRRKT